jgi:phosphopantothenoylcysteine decarboxylase/phosphopantothenate--cysteine ligase
MRPILITAGATRNPIDAMRVLTATSTGTTGIRLARALEARGGRVHVLGSPEALLRAGSEGSQETFGSTRDLLVRMEAWTRKNARGVVVHSAAVGDYEMAEAQGKIPSGQAELTLRLRPTPKIVDQLKLWDPLMFLVSFKAAAPGTDEDALEAIARAQLVRTRSDLVFANVLGRLGRGILLVSPEGVVRHEGREAAVEDLLARLARAARL